MMGDDDRGSITSTWRADKAITTVRTRVIVPFTAVDQRGCEFVVYHVCSHCHRPRSVKFHHDHPTRIGRPIPPSTVCGRCQKVIQEATPNTQAIIQTSYRENISNGNNSELQKCSLSSSKQHVDKPVYRHEYYRKEK